MINMFNCLIERHKLTDTLNFDGITVDVDQCPDWTIQLNIRENDTLFFAINSKVDIARAAEVEVKDIVLLRVPFGQCLCECVSAVGEVRTGVLGK